MFGYVVVGADLQAHHLVHRVAAAGDDDQAAVPVFTQLARDGQAVFTRQTQIEQHQGRGIVCHQLQQRRAGMQRGDAKPMAAEVVGQQQGDIGFVVDNGQVRLAHPGSVPPRSFDPAQGASRTGRRDCRTCNSPSSAVSAPSPDRRRCWNAAASACSIDLADRGERAGT
jgi:hypothetical protein